MSYRIFDFLERFIYVIFFIVLGFIIGLNIFISRGYSTIGAIPPKYFNLITLVIALLLIGLLIRFRDNIIGVVEKIRVTYWVAGLLSLSLLFQLITLKLYRVSPSWDFAAVVNLAKLFLEGGEMDLYYTIYPNNIFMFCLAVILGKILSPELITYQIINIMVIVASQFLIFRIASKLAGKSVGIISLVVSILFFPYIFYAPIVYTDTFSLLFLLLPLNILIDKDGEFRSNFLLIFAASILFSLGMLLKGSLIVFVIAFSITLFLYQKGWKKTYFILPFLVLLLIKTIFTSSLYGLGILEEQRVEKNSFPVTHWIVMGQNPSMVGKYSQKDFDWTRSLLAEHPKSEVSGIHLQELKNRLKEKGFMGNVKFNIKKTAHTWTDGTYYSLNKLKRRPIEPENFESLVNYKSGHLVQGYVRIQHLILLIGLLFVLKLKGLKINRSFLTFSVLSIIGFFFFFILWETRSRYLVSLTPLIILLSCLGYFGIKKNRKSIE